MVDGIIKSVGEAIRPPGISDIDWWRIVVSALILGLVIFSIWAIGAFGGGFAMAGDVDKVRKHQLAQRLDNIHYHLCMADSTGTDRQLVDLARELEQEFREVNDGQPYEVNCTLLLKLRQ